MSFSLKIDGTVAQIAVGAADDNSAAFLEAAKKCFSQRATRLIVDVTAFPQVAGVIVDALLKVQQFVQTKGEKVTLVGASSADPHLEKLKSAGIVVETSSAVTAPAPVQVVAPPAPTDNATASVEGLKEFFTKMESTDTLPTAGELSPLVSKVLNCLKDMLIKDELLTKEKRLYEKRLDFISKNLSGDPSKLKDYEALLSQEADANSLRQTMTGLKKDLFDATQAAEGEEKSHKEFESKFVQDSRKKMETLKKELDNLKAQRGKIEQEFQKKSDARKAEIAKLQGAAPKQ